MYNVQAAAERALHGTRTQQNLIIERSRFRIGVARINRGQDYWLAIPVLTLHEKQRHRARAHQLPIRESQQQSPRCLPE